jgi:predicted nucleic acid-binding protein
MMILVDTSVWIDHFRRGDLRLAGFLDRGNAVMHPFVLGELTLGHLSGIAEVIDDLRRLPKAAVANTDEVLEFIVDRKLPGSGIGYVDVHLLAAAALVPETLVWTRDRRLLAAAQSLSLAAEFREGR